MDKRKLQKANENELENTIGGAYFWGGDTDPQYFRCKESTRNCNVCGERIEWWWHDDRQKWTPDQVWDCGRGRIPLRNGDGEPPERYDK